MRLNYTVDPFTLSLSFACFVIIIITTRIIYRGQMGDDNDDGSCYHSVKYFAVNSLQAFL